MVSKNKKICLNCGNICDIKDCFCMNCGYDFSKTQEKPNKEPTPENTAEDFEENIDGSLSKEIIIAISIIFFIFLLIGSLYIYSKKSQQKNIHRCDDDKIKKIVIDKFKENDYYYKYINPISIDSIDLKYVTIKNFNKKENQYYCKGVIVLESSDNGFIAEQQHDGNPYYMKIHNINTATSEEKLLKYTKYDYEVEYTSKISPNGKAIVTFENLDNLQTKGKFYCSGDCDAEIIKEAENTSQFEEMFQNNNEYSQRNIKYIVKTGVDSENYINQHKKTNKENAEPDFSVFMNDLQQRIKLNWSPPKGDANNHVVVLIKIAKDGKLLSCDVSESSGYLNYDNAALEAVYSAAPFRSLPKEFTGSSIDVQFSFDYNVTPR